MFEKDLADRFERIFGAKKVTYNNPGSSNEQDCLFIDVDKSVNTIEDGEFSAKVNGTCTMFAPSQDLTFGFFSKAIANASPDDTKHLFFYDIEENSRRYVDIVQRSFSFVYFFRDQYNPARGNITEVDFKEGPKP